MMAAPTQVASYVAPPASYAAPTMATVAAPAMMAAPTQVASFVAPPAVAPAMAMTGPPVNLLEGLPKPEQIEGQKAGYAKALEQQFKAGSDTISKETEIKKKMLIDTAEQQKAQYTLQVQSQLQQQNLLLDQQMNSQIMMLQEAAMQQKSALEQQAAALTLEYQQKKAEEEMLVKQYQIQKQFYDAEQKLAAQFQKVTQQEVTALNKLGVQAAQ